MKYSISSLASVILLLYPFLDYYGYGFVSIAFVFALIYIFYVVKKRGCLKLAFQLPMLLYILYFVVARMYFATSIREMIVPSILFVFIFWGILNIDLSIHSFLKWYRRIAYVNIAFFFVQECMYQLLGYRIVGILTFLPLTIGDANLDISGWEERTSLYARSSAFFSEPAHFAQYLLPLLVIELFYVSDKKSRYRCLLYIVALIASSSGNALAGLAVVLLFYIVRLCKKLNAYVISIWAVVFAVMIPIGVSQILMTEYGENILERQEELDPEQSSVSSGFIRVFRGFYIWDEMSTLEKCWGLNSTNRIKGKIKKCEVSFTFKENDLYMNCFQSFIIQTGIVGTCLFTFFLISLWRNNNIAGRCCIGIFLILSLIAAIYFSVNNMVLLLISAYLMKKEAKGKASLCYLTIPFNLNKGNNCSRGYLPSKHSFLRQNGQKRF